MKKSAIALTTLLSITMTTPVFAGVDISIDGTPVNFTTSTGYPIMDNNGRTLVPLRVAMEAYGCTVNWNEPTKTAIVEKDGSVVTIVTGESYMHVNGVRVANDAEAKIIDGRVYLPIRAVLEALGASVSWDEAGNSITVVSDEQKKTPEKDNFDDIYINDQGDLVFKFFEGKEINVGKVTGEKGRRGSSGSDGISVTDAYIDQTGCLIILLSDGEEINAGRVAATSGAESDAKTFDDYRVGTKWYLTQPKGDFEVVVMIEGSPVSVYFDEIYYELTAKNDFDSEDAWKYESFRTRDESVYVPYEVTVNISGRTDRSLTGKGINVVLHDDTVGVSWGYSAVIDDSGEFCIELIQGIDDNDNVWYQPKVLYLKKVTISDAEEPDEDE